MAYTGLALYTVDQQTEAVVERFGKFHNTASPGLHIRIPIADSIRARVSLRVQELEVNIRTKTKDNVIVDLVVAVQFYVEQKDVFQAFYRLTDPRNQIQSYIFDTVRAKVPGMTLDEVYEKKEDIATDVEEKLKDNLAGFGYTILTALINDIQPDPKVADAMNEINAAQRLRVAAEEKGEAEKILVVKAAEADARSKELSGEGIAKQRKAIIDGLKESVEDFQKAIEGIDARDVMSLIMLTQYYDMMTAVGEKSNSNVVMIPHSPGAVGELRDTILEALVTNKQVR